MSKLPWSERVPMLSIHPDAATRHDVAQMAAELMDANARVAELEAAIADERKHALDLWKLAAMLHDDDCFYGDRRNAPARLAVAGDAMGWPDGMRQFYLDAVGYPPEDAARRTKEAASE